MPAIEPRETIQYGSVTPHITNPNLDTDVSLGQNKFGIQHLKINAKMDLPVSNQIVVTYSSDTASASPQETVTASELTLDLTPLNGEQIVVGSVIFKFGNITYKDQDGYIYELPNVDESLGAQVGSIDYLTGIVTLTNWNGGGSNSVELKSLMVNNINNPISTMSFRVPITPVKPLSFTLRWVDYATSQLRFVTSDSDGVLDATGINGSIDYGTGIVQIVFGEFVDATASVGEDWYDPLMVHTYDNTVMRPEHAQAATVEYNAVGISNTPLSSEILGLNPVRIPEDGRIPVYNAGDVVVIINDTVVSGTYTAGQVVSTGQTNVAKITVYDSVNQPVTLNKYTVDLAAGTVNILDVTGVSQPMSVKARIEDMSVLSEVQVTGELKLALPTKHAYPILGTLVCSTLLGGNLYARVGLPFDQVLWAGEWLDERGADPVSQIQIPACSAQFNTNQFPVQVTNASTITEQWALIFTSSTTFDVVGQNVGVLGSGNTTSDTVIINPETTDPYMVIDYRAFGLGWLNGNVIRFATYGCGLPAWLVQSISQGDATSTDYISCVEFRGSKAS